MSRRNVMAQSRLLVVAGIALSNIPTIQLSAQDSFPSRPPTPSALALARFPPFQEVALANGITLLVVANHEQPIISASLSFRAGAIYDAPGKEGTAEFVAQLLTKGTATRSAEQIAATIEGVGGNLSASSGDDFLTLSLDVLSDHADLAFDLLGDVSRQASFPLDELELARTQALSALSLALSQPENIADRFFNREIYGRHPYGRSPTSDSYRAITQNDVKRFAAGDSAGYGQRWRAPVETYVGVLPIGYGDGVRRGLTNNADVLVGGHRQPLVGTVSMDNVTIEFGPATHVSPGAPATLIGAQGEERILCEEVARRLETINYEVTCGISRRVPRIYLD